MLNRLNYFTIVLVSVGAFLTVTVLAIALTEVAPFGGSGPINSAAAQNRALEDRVLSLERHVANLNSKMEQVAAKLDLEEEQEQPSHNEAASPTAPPSHLNSDSFYTKYLDVAGIPILAPESVPDKELEQARDIVLSMTIDRPDLLNRLAENEFRILLYNERMEGGINQLPEFRDFQYHDPTGGLFDETERVIGVAMMVNHDCNPVLIHEFGHALEWALEELQPESDFRYNLTKTYRNARTAGLWEGRYANTASTEYWAEMLRYWL